MNNAKFTLNALLVVIMAFSAIGLLVTVNTFDAAGYMYSINDYHPIKGTDLWIRYATKEPSGIYKGMKNTAELKLEGRFGYDWGVAVCGDDLYLNEYFDSDAGLVMSDLVRVNMDTFEEETVCGNTILRGRCASGELVCISDCMLPSNMTKTNSLCKLYAMTDPELDPSSDGATVMFLDPSSGEVVYSVWDDHALTDKLFDKRYLIRTLEEVRQ